MVTPLYGSHMKLGARMTDFAGWEMPVQYSSIVDEHRATRTSAGIFDVSHMGELWVSGEGAYEYIEYLATNDMSRLKRGKWAYSPICAQGGGTVDDLIVYPVEDGFLCCVNASNTFKDYEWFRLNAPAGVAVENHSDRYAQIALQGPKAKEFLSAVPPELILLKPATGYTGEKGFELYVQPEHAEAVWGSLLSAGATPCGLGARDTLRMEAAFPLYGHEISESISPIEGGLSRFVNFDKGEFIGRGSLLRQLDDPNRRELIGLRSSGRVIPRQGYDVLCGGEKVGAVTSGGPGCFIGGQIAMALVYPCEGEFAVLVRGKPEPMERVPLPFYKSM